jgi:fructokinase
MQLYGGIEAGGTKFVCAVAANPTDEPVDITVIPTTTPEETLGKTIEFFKKHDLKALGVASFGPVDLHRDSPTYGYITATPKPGWRNTDLLEPLRQFNVPIGFDTDVNGAALGEWRYGGGQGMDSVIYITIGTGIGGGVLVNGNLIHGLMHPEIGHIPVRHHSEDTFEGFCPFHKCCFEGMASGPSLKARWGQPAIKLALDHKAWEFEAYYIAQAISTLMYTISPQRIILGGGVMHQEQLFPAICTKTIELINGYIQEDSLLKHIDQLIIPPALGDRAGATGALELARLALES